MKKKEKNENNLASILPDFYDFIKASQIGPSFLAKGVFDKEWEEDNDAVKLKLIGRLRNKLDGSGRLSMEELSKLQTVLLDLSNLIKLNVERSKEATVHQRKEKIKSFLADMNVNKLDDLKELLKE